VACGWLALAWPLGSVLGGIGIALLGSAEGARVTSPGYLALLQEPIPAVRSWGTTLVGVLGAFALPVAWFGSILLVGGLLGG
jgi:hypothetical protein